MFRPSIAVALSLVACAGPVPDPRRMANELPEARDVDAARRAELDARVETALRMLTRGEVTAARSLALQVLEFDPTHARARAILGQCHLVVALDRQSPSLEELRLAEGEFLRATRLAPDDVLVGRLHAGFLVADGHLSAAAARLDQLLETAPNDPSLLELAGRVHFDLGDELAAVPLLARRAALVESDSASLWRLAQCHARLCQSAPERADRQRHGEAAAAAFRHYGELAPNDVEALLGEAWALLFLLPETVDADAIAPVLAVLDRAARLRPESAEPAFDRGLALQRIGDHDSARAAWREALALNPRHGGAVLALGASYATTDEDDDARPFLVRALELELSDDERTRVTDWLEAHSPANNGRK